MCVHIRVRNVLFHKWAKANLVRSKEPNAYDRLNNFMYKHEIHVLCKIWKIIDLYKNIALDKTHFSRLVSRKKLLKLFHFQKMTRKAKTSNFVFVLFSSSSSRSLLLLDI